MHVVFDSLKKEFGGKVVLDTGCGEIMHGRSTAIIGPNGAGKSTLLSVIAGILPQTSGTVYYDGSGAFPQNDVSMVFQDPYMISTTVEKNIIYPLKIRGVDKREREKRAEFLLAELGLEKLRKQHAWKLSGGEKQKVALARALSFRPKLLLLDEPTANIDPYTTSEIENMLDSIRAKEDTTVVIVTHNLAQAARMCDRLIMMYAGDVIESGECMQILKAPSDDKTRRFVQGEILI